MNTTSFQSYLVVGGSLSERKKYALHMVEKLKIAEVDQIIKGDTETIKIEHVREIIQFLSRPPYASSHKVVLLFEIQSASLETQHAILKTLEEPPAFATIILTTPRKESVLPTILSRSIVLKTSIYDQKTYTTEHIFEVIKILSESIGKRFEYGSNVGKDSEQTLLWLQNTLSSTRLYVLSHQKKASPADNKTYSKFMKQISRAIKTVSSTNTNPRLLMENLLLELPMLPRLDRKTD